MDKEAWQAAVHGVAKSWTQLGDFCFTYCLGYYNFAISFEIIKCKSSGFILVQDLFDYLRSLRFHINFRGIFFYFCQKKNLRILIGTALNLLITLGSTDILTVLKSANL